MKERLNVLVGDVVKVIYPQNRELSYVALVEKVLPNGRFKTERCEEYWRADGTKNTHAKKWEKDQYVVNGSLDDYETKYRELIALRLRLIANTIERVCLGGNIQGLTTFNKILTAYGWDDNEMIAKLERAIHEKKLKKFMIDDRMVATFTPDQVDKMKKTLYEYFEKV